MTIGLNDTLNSKTEFAKEKTSKKTDSSLDFSTISNQFSSIFSNQFNTQFKNQFDYQKMFTSAPTTNFVASTVSSVSENNHPVSKDFSSKQESGIDNQKYKDDKESVKDYSKEQKIQSSDTKEKEIKSSDKKDEKDIHSEKEVKKESKTDEEKQVNQNVLDETIVIADKAQQPEKTAKPKKTSDKSEETIEVVQDMAQDLTKADDKSVKVALKEVAQSEDVSETELKVLDKNIAKVEKLEVKKRPQATNEDTKQVVKEKTDVDSSDAKKIEDLQKKAGMERVTANVIEEAPVEATQAETKTSKLFDAKDKAFTLKSDKAATAVADAKSSNTFMQNQGQNQQGFSQQQSFSQNQQSNERPVLQGVLNNTLAFDPSMMKNTLGQNLNFGQAMQSAQATSMMDRNIADQVMKQIQGNISAKDSQVTMVLQPEKLGKVTLSIMNEKGVLTAEIKTESKEAADALNKNIQDLKETLKQQGVTTANLVVKVENSEKSQNQMNFSQQNQGQNAQEFSQGNNTNFGQNQQSFENKSQGNTNYQYSNNEQNDIQEQEVPMENTKAEVKQGVVDYRV